jgi:hypothetical protein
MVFRGGGIQLRKLLAVSIFLLLLCSTAKAQAWSGVVAASRAEDWSKAGVPSGIPSSSWTQCGPTIPSTATIATINAAISSCTANHYVQLGAGTFNLAGGLLWNTISHVAVRGMGANQTFLVFSNLNSCLGSDADVCFQSGDTNYQGSPQNLTTWSAGYSVGTTSITLAAVSNLAVGNSIMLDQCDTGLNTGNGCTAGTETDNGAVFICSDSTCALNGDGGIPRPNRGQEQMVTVTSISGSGPYTVGITPALIMPNWASSQTPQAWWSSSPSAYDGLENVSLNVGTSGPTSTLAFFNCNNCWVTGTRFVGPPGRSHIAIQWSQHVTVAFNYFYKVDQGTGSVQYGVETSPGSDCLVLSNIFEDVQAPYPADGSATGCVYAYNFDVNNYFPNNSGNPNFLNQSGFPHAVGDEHMLYEGNIGAGIYSDNFHGTHNFITIERNAYNGFQQDRGFVPTGGIGPLILPAYSRFYNVIGNVLGSPVLPFNFYEDSTAVSTGEWPIYVLGLTTDPPVPNDSITTTTVMRWGNYDSNTATSRFVSSEVPSGLTGVLAPFANPVPSSTTLPASFYLSAQPSWWPSGKPWPPIGPDVSSGNVSICNGGVNTAAYVTLSSQCPGGTLAAMGTHINSNPAMDCFLITMGGSPIGTDPAALPFTCTYASSGVVSLSPSSENFGSIVVASSSSAVAFTLTNNSAASATSVSLSLGGTNPGDFAISANTCGSTLAASASCTLNVTFTPTATGSRAATLIATYSGGDGFSPQASTLSGTGTASSTAPTVTTMTATGITATGATSGGTVTSNGGATVTAEGVACGTSANPTAGTGCSIASGGTATPFTITLSGLTPSTTYFYRAYATNSVGTGYGSDLSFTTLSSCTTPVMIGVYTLCNQSTLSLGGSASTISTNLTPFAGNGIEIFGIICANTATCNATPTQTLVISDNINNPETCFTAAPNSPYLSNNTTTPDEVKLWAAYCPSIPAGVTSFTLTWSAIGYYPQITAIEWKAGGIASSGYFESVDSVGFVTTGTSISIPTSGPTVNANDLITGMTQTCGGSVPQTVGTGYTGILVNTPQPGYIAQAKGVTSTATYNMTSTWAVPAPTSCGGGVGNNDSAYGIIVPLKGVISGNMTLTPTTQAFGSVNVGSSSSPVTFTVTNNSASSATGLTVANSGGNTADFVISGSTCTSTLAASASCTLSITFTPAAGGARSTTLQASYSGADGASPRDSVLSGTGVNPTAAIPACTPAGGTFTATTGPITCTDSTGGALICYNQTGYVPIGGASSCPAGSTHYTAPFALTVTGTVYAWAGGAALTDSAAVSYAFTVNPTGPPAPTKIMLVQSGSTTVTNALTAKERKKGVVTADVSFTCTCTIIVATQQSTCSCPITVSEY